MNATEPSCNTSSLIDEVKLPENTIVALLLVLGDLNIINDEVKEFVIVDPETIKDPLILISVPVSIAILLVRAADPLNFAK
jgi:hypothetical protein